MDTQRTAVFVYFINHILLVDEWHILHMNKMIKCGASTDPGEHPQGLCSHNESDWCTCGLLHLAPLKIHATLQLDVFHPLRLFTLSYEWKSIFYVTPVQCIHENKMHMYHELDVQNVLLSYVYLTSTE